MQTKILFSYVENVVPPRCRKPRAQRFHDGEITLEVPEITGSEAPVAIRSKGEFIHIRGQHYGVDYRWWNGELWTSCHLDGNMEPSRALRSDQILTVAPIPEVLDLRSDWRISDTDLGVYVEWVNPPKVGVEAALRAAVQNRVLIDGVPHHQVSEPRYVVMTFGLGANHGGTALMTSNHYNSNIPHDRYFNLLERDQAIALATEIATKRGDLKSLPIQAHGPEFEVLIPESIQVQPSIQHGAGDPFLVSLDALTQQTQGSPVVGLMAGLMAAATK